MARLTRRGLLGSALRSPRARTLFTTTRSRGGNAIDLIAPSLFQRLATAVQIVEASGAQMLDFPLSLADRGCHNTERGHIEDRDRVPTPDPLGQAAQPRDQHMHGGAANPRIPALSALGGVRLRDCSCGRALLHVVHAGALGRGQAGQRIFELEGRQARHSPPRGLRRRNIRMSVAASGALPPFISTFIQHPRATR